VSIKSDKWIRREAEKGMIEPFEPGQVKTNAAGDRLISYGTSSYGYDVRCSDHFKILPTSTLRWSTRKIFLSIALLISPVMSASFRLIRSLWLAPSRILKSREVY